MEAGYIILIVSLQIITVLVSIFYKSYAKKKGENLATKQDVQEITEKVEAIKTQFVGEIEHLKSDLQYKNIIKTTIYSETKESVIQVYESLQVLNKVIRKNLSSAIIRTPKDRRRGWELSELKIEEYTLCFAKVQLYVRSDRYIEAVLQVASKIEDLSEMDFTLMMDLEMLEVNIDAFKIEDRMEDIKNKDKIYLKSNKKALELAREIAELMIDLRDESFKIISTP